MLLHLTRRRLLGTGAAAAVVTAVMATAGRPARAARERIKIRDLYAAGGAFSELAERLVGETVEMPGFMAPPLKPDASFFVLTKMPMAVCPFCNDEADWPRDIVFVRLAGEPEWVPFNRPIVVTGTLELGTEVNEETGFVSRVRLTDARYEVGR